MSLKDAIHGNLNSWQGLTKKETLESLAEEFEPVKMIHKAQERQRTYQRFMMTLFERDTPPFLIEAWFTWGSKNAALIEYDHPRIQNVEQILKTYGNPDLTVSDKRYTTGAIVKEYIYAHRGAALSVAEPYAPSRHPERTFVHLQLFPACSIEFYITDIGTETDFYPRTHPPEPRTSKG